MILFDGPTGAGPQYLLSFGDVAVACGFLFVNIYTAMQRSVRLEAIGRVSGLYVAAFYMGFGLTGIWTPSRTAMLAAWETASASAAWCTWWSSARPPPGCDVRRRARAVAAGSAQLRVRHLRQRVMFVNVYAMTQKAVGAGDVGKAAGIASSAHYLGAGFAGALFGAMVDAWNWHYGAALH